MICGSFAGFWQQIGGLVMFSTPTRRKPLPYAAAGLLDDALMARGAAQRALSMALGAVPAEERARLVGQALHLVDTASEHLKKIYVEGRHE